MDKNPTNLPDDELLRLWRSVQGPLAKLNGPLIRYAGLVYRAAKQEKESKGRSSTDEVVDIDSNKS